METAMMTSLFKPVAFALVAATLAVTAAPQKAEAGNGGAIVAGAVIGLAAGMIAGSAYAGPHYYHGPRRVYHGYGYRGYESRKHWCASRFRSYDWGSGTYVDRYGRVRYCG
jgi:BA14K-like protein